MALTSRRATRAALVLLALLGVGASVDGVRLWRLTQINRALTDGQTAADDAARVPELQFAAAFALSASGADAAAVDRYRALHGHPALGPAARYNSANALLRQAMRLRDGERFGLALPLIELAKETYRDVLREDPDHWPARYNLERAQRLVPDPDPADDDPVEAPRSAERAATTMRGYAPGLP